jgi:hypothetical protein
MSSTLAHWEASIGKKTTKTSSTSAPPSWAVGPLTSGMNDIVNTVQGNAGNLSAQSAALSGMLPGMQQQIANTGKQLQPGIGYVNSVLGGKYLNNNPYMNQMVSQTANDVGNRVNSTFSLAGRTGGGDNKIQLAEGLANAENQLRYGDYQNERNQMTQAAGMLPALTSAQYAGYAPYLQASQLAGQMPYLRCPGSQRPRRHGGRLWNPNRDTARRGG